MLRVLTFTPAGLFTLGCTRESKAEPPAEPKLELMRSNARLWSVATIVITAASVVCMRRAARERA